MRRRLDILVYYGVEQPTGDEHQFRHTSSVRQCGQSG
jgi:hypothetical protein